MVRLSSTEGRISDTKGVRFGLFVGDTLIETDRCSFEVILASTVEPIFLKKNAQI
jgi:hypothetical protein